MEEEKNNTPQNYITNPHFELRHFSPYFFNYAVLNLYVEKTIVCWMKNQGEEISLEVLPKPKIMHFNKA